MLQDLHTVPEDPTRVDELLQGLREECSRLGMPVESLGRSGEDERLLLSACGHSLRYTPFLVDGRST